MKHIKKFNEELDERPRGGSMFSGSPELVQEVINRISEYGDLYILALEEMNKKFPSTKYKSIDSVRNVELPSGVKVQSTAYPNR